MKKEHQNFVQEALASFQRLQQRRGELQAEIDEIDQALGQFGSARAPAHRMPVATARRSMNGRKAMPLREAIVQVLSAGPQTRQEILDGVQRVGYRFAATDPMNSLQAFLYGPGKKLFIRHDGKFGLAGGASSAAGAVKNGADKPAKAKRTMSAAARKKIAAAQKARWAKFKAAKK